MVGCASSGDSTGDVPRDEWAVRADTLCSAAVDDLQSATEDQAVSRGLALIEDLRAIGREGDTEVVQVLSDFESAMNSETTRSDLGHLKATLQRQRAS
jgi:hypothetical protein